MATVECFGGPCDGDRVNVDDSLKDGVKVRVKYATYLYNRFEKHNLKGENVFTETLQADANTTTTAVYTLTNGQLRYYREPYGPKVGQS